MKLRLDDDKMSKAVYTLPYADFRKIYNTTARGSMIARRVYIPFDDTERLAKFFVAVRVLKIKILSDNINHKSPFSKKKIMMTVFLQYEHQTAFETMTALRLNDCKKREADLDEEENKPK